MVKRPAGRLSLPPSLPPARPPARPVLPHSTSSGSRGWALSGGGGVSKRWLLHDCEDLHETAEGENS